MTEIALDLIDPNPFRDFDLHPIDEAQVERLKASIEADGFWASVAARKAGDRYQLAFGHHRIAAARGRGLDHVPIEVRVLSDWQMVRMLASENATQRGTTAAAALDAIAAISRVLAFTLFRHAAPEFSIIFENLPGYAEMRGRLEAGSGIGEPCILAAMPAGAFTTAQVRIALGILKDSGRMAAIVAEAREMAEAELGAEHQDRPAAPAPTFDARCARLFKLDSHLAEFRRIVTGEVVRDYLPVEKQFEFAERVLADLAKHKQEVTAINLRERANGLFYEQMGLSRATMPASPKRIVDARLRDALNLLRRGVHDAKRGSAMLAVVLDEGIAPDAMAKDRMARMADDLEAAAAILRPQPRTKLRVIGGDVA